MSSSSFKNLSFYINKAKEVHGNKYDYSLITEENFIDTRVKLPIICPIHGVFYQNFNKHNSNRGCPDCGRERSISRKSLSHFITKAKAIHGNKYDYSLITEEDWIGSKAKYNIICPIHGVFKQSFSNHCNRKGCPKCGKILAASPNKKRRSLKEFIQEANRIHNNRYDYSKISEYNFQASKKVLIVCPEHGEFWQTPATHLLGRKCPKCRATTRKTLEQVKKDLEAKNFSHLTYLNLEKHADSIKISEFIIKASCSKHGEFSMILRNLLDSECGCPSCAKEKIANSNRMTYDEFLVLAHKAHGDNFIYPESARASFKGRHQKTAIICRKHGEFRQQAGSHIRGIGCWKCQRSRMEEVFELKLKELKINFVPQKTFPDLRGENNMPLYFDFYLPERNELIELDGPQHYQFGDLGKFIVEEEDFRKLRQRDKKKELYAVQNGFKFTRVKFNEFGDWVSNFS